MPKAQKSKTPKHSLASKPKGKRAQTNNSGNDNCGLVGLLRNMRANEPNPLLLENEINALTALGLKLDREETAKENRVKGKADRYSKRKQYVTNVYRDLKQSMGKKPPLKVVLSELEQRYPEKPQTENDPGFKPWTAAQIKQWVADLNKGKTIIDGS